MQNILTYKDLGYLFDEIYDGEIGAPEQQKNEFVSRLCQGKEEIFPLAESIWFTMIDVYEGNISNDEKPQYVQIINSNLSEINELIGGKERFCNYKDLLELVERMANQEYDSPDDERQAFAFRLCEGHNEIFEVAQDIWFTVINIRDGVIAEPEKDQYIAIVNSSLSEINKFLDDQQIEEQKCNKIQNTFAQMVIQQKEGEVQGMTLGK